MSEAPIDAFNFLDKEKKKNRANLKVVSGILGLLFLIAGFIGFSSIFRLFTFYFDFRHKIPFWFGLNAVVIAISLSVLPIVTGRVILNSSDKKITWTNYLIWLGVTVILYVFFLVFGLELLFVLPKPDDINPLLPGYTFVPPFPYCFDFLFVFSPGMSCLLLWLFFRTKKRQTNRTNNT